MSEKHKGTKKIASSAFHRLLKCNLVVVVIVAGVGSCCLTLKMEWAQKCAIGSGKIMLNKNLCNFVEH